MRSFSASILSILFFLILAGCSSNNNPMECSELKDVVLSKETGQILLTGTIVINNPNSKSHKIQRLDSDIYVNQKIVGSINTPLNQEVKGNSTFNHEFSINFPPEKVYSGFMAKRLGSFGTTDVKVGVIGEALCFYKEEKVPVIIDVFEEITVRN